MILTVNHAYAEPAYRAVSIIGLIQTVVVVAGTLFVSVMVKAYGYGGGNIPDRFFRSDALFIRHYGFAFLLIPVAWASIAIFLTRAPIRPWIAPAMLLLGAAIVIIGICSYVTIGISPTIL